jgi:GNAT superfamily N-acetyltransferase
MHFDALRSGESPRRARDMIERTAPSRSASGVSIARAIEAFAHGFCFTRSFTHPYIADRVGPVWVVRDAPRSRGDYRREEWIAHGVPPAEVDRLARARTRGGFAICAIRAVDEPEDPLRDGYKALGYRLGTTEPMMIHRLQRIPRPAAPARIERVTTQAMADRVAKAARTRQVLPEHFGDGSRLRQYVALVEGRNEPVGWVRSIDAGNRATWCSNMYVHPDFRRRGIARALLARMLRDDRAAGAKAAVLLASHVGAKLYEAVGYEQIGTLLLFTPVRR